MKKRAALSDKKFSLDSLDDPRGLDNPLFVPDETKTSNSSPTINSPVQISSSSESMKNLNIETKNSEFT